jgi:murein DD-endopeptidase MepM/ murein hydrolase activator NlpD
LKNGLMAAGKQLLARAAHALEHHPKHVTAVLAALMLGGGGAAFAVASLDPDPSTIAVRQVLESVEPLPVQDQLQALDVFSFNLFRSELTRAGDTVDSLLARLGIEDLQAALYLRKDASVRAQLLGRAGRNVTAEASESQQLQKLSARWASAGDDGTFKRLVIERNAQGGFSTRVETAPLVAAARMGSATVHTSLFAAADDARIPDGVVGKIVEIFSTDIDFHHDLHAGDRFNVVYEALEADGEPMRTGRILSAEFANNGKVHQAMWFQEPGRKGGYYTLDGKSLDTSYLASPMEFSRVTSGFASRFHPILHRWKAHLGVDYGADMGTPVRTVGAGVVEFAGQQNGFGNVVIVKHNNTDQTVYAHLSRIDVQPGQMISQGQHLGAVGATGWATGPHLHFEFRVNGVHHDPVEMARNSDALPLSAAARPEFDRLARSMRAQLAAAGSSRTALARAD